MALKEKVERTKDWAAMNLDKVLPKRALYWITMVEIGKATMTSQNVPATSLDNILTNLGNVREGKPLEQFIWHDSWRYPLEDHAEHVHVAPSQLPIPETPLHERPLDNGKNGGYGGIVDSPGHD